MRKLTVFAAGLMAAITVSLSTGAATKNRLFYGFCISQPGQPLMITTVSTDNIGGRKS